MTDDEDYHVRGATQSQLQTSAYDLRWMTPTRPAHEIAVHRHDDAHLILVLQGDYQTSAAGVGRLHAGEPMLVLNPPRTEHVDCFAPDQVLSQARFFSFALAADTWFGATKAMQLPAVPVAMEGAVVRRFAQQWTRHVSRECAAEDAETTLLAALAPFCKDRARLAATSLPWVQRVQRMLRERVVAGEGLESIAAMATRLGVHPVYLARAFRKHVGLSPSDYVRGLQLDKAAALLTGTRTCVVDIALECLYFDQAHLVHAFRAAYGLSPTAYRAQRLG